MDIRNTETKKYLMGFGWSPDRTANLPPYIDRPSTPAIVISTLENLNELEFKNPGGYKRIFSVDDAYIRDFAPDMQEWLDETGLDLKFYPLGEMSEYGGILVLDQFGRFYLAGDELIYYG